MSYVPRPVNHEQAEAVRRFMRWVKGKTAAQIRAEYLKGAPTDGTVVGELAMWSAEAKRLAAENSELKKRIRIAKRALRKSTKYEPWDDFEWTAAVALDMRRKDYVRRK